MARRRRSNGASKHNNLISKHNDLILKPKRVIKNRPVDWAEDDEGDLQPIFAPEPLFTPEELEPYRSNRALFDHKRSLRKLVGPPFPFLKLPTELRVEIYRYVLVQNYHIYLVYYKTVRKHPTKLALSLLRTCSAMHDECAQILYGENRFAFWNTYDHLELLRFLNHIGPVNRRWLKTLTMTPPLLHEDEPVYSDKTRLYADLERPEEYLG
ncbi:uncharacterized protein J4E78_002778 [Alternaria triticimaculans]|uniref:uncharacterized protein n=1 Tax=Alternaria triticimaculans TaxID=297637 RepID=UPI0020C2BF69|nr:uncharacterized protein J4E78_002778 [Alternaria triticimaculans]KAI4665318.1 hypothetical protein J4E78_002778 [Alternaria triticimaculans]